MWDGKKESKNGVGGKTGELGVNACLTKRAQETWDQKSITGGGNSRGKIFANASSGGKKAIKNKFLGKFRLGGIRGSQIDALRRSLPSRHQWSTWGGKNKKSKKHKGQLVRVEKRRGSAVRKCSLQLRDVCPQ